MKLFRALYILHNEDAAAHGVYKFGTTDNLRRRKYDACYTTAARRPWTYVCIFEIREDLSREVNGRPLDALCAETLVKRELRPLRATPLGSYYGTELFQDDPLHIAAVAERVLKDLALTYVRRDFQKKTDQHGHSFYEDGFPVPSWCWSDEDADQLIENVAPPEPDRPRPRGYQEEALSACMEGLKDATRGRVLMACGTGKTLTMFWLAERLNAQVVALVVPRLDLGAQTLDVWSKQYHMEGRARPRLAIAASKSLAPPGWPVLCTTDQGILRKWFNETAGPRLIVATYDSSGTLADLDLDLLLLDEAHHTAPHENETQEQRRNLLLLNEKIVSARRRVSFTATNKKTMKEETHGKVLFRYGFERAIEEGHLVDYQVVVLSQNESGGSTDTPEAEAIVRALADYPIRKLLVFAGNRVQGRKLRDSLEQYYEKRGEMPLVAYLDSGSPLKMRRKVLGEIETCTRQAILINVRLFVEGVDLPELDGIALCCPKSSTSELTQIISRALRPAFGKTGAYIVVPAVVRKETLMQARTLAEAKRQDGFYKVFKLLRVLAKLDHEVHAAACAGRLQRARAIRVLSDGSIPDIELSDTLTTLLTDHLREKLRPTPRILKYEEVPAALKNYGLLLRVNQGMYDYRRAFTHLEVVEWKVPGLEIPAGTPVAILANSPLGILAFGVTEGDSYKGTFTNDGYWTPMGVRESERNRDRQREFVKVRINGVGDPELVTRKMMLSPETVTIEVGDGVFEADAGEQFMARKIRCRRAIATFLDKGAFLRLVHLSKKIS